MEDRLDKILNHLEKWGSRGLLGGAGGYDTVIRLLVEELRGSGPSLGTIKDGSRA